MDLIENVYLAVTGLLANKMRALLTMLGIIIGIASVIAIMTLGDSVQNTVTDTMQDMGGNNIMIVLQNRDNTSGSSITSEDYMTDEMFDTAQAMYPDEFLGYSASHSVGSGQAKDGRKYANLSISGVNEGYKSATVWKW